MKNDNLGVDVAGFPIVDLGYSELVEALVSAAIGDGAVAYAAHVGALAHSENARFRDALDRADFVYADGAAIVLLARLAGAQRVERSPTTDLGWSVLRVLATRLGRKPRVVLLGGPPGLAARAARVFVAEGCEVCATYDGYDDLRIERLPEQIRAAQADVLFVGLGMPREALFVEENALAGTAKLIMTCGGWFNFITGAERRAPRWAQKAGLEWTYRLAQDPRGKAMRYVVGASFAGKAALSILGKGNR